MGSDITSDLRPLLTCTDSAVMVSAARVVGNMVRIAGATLGDPFFTKEIDQALQMLEGRRIRSGMVETELIWQILVKRSDGLAVS